MISANQAYHMGLLNRVVAPETLEAETMALAQQIAGKPRATVKIGKEAFYRQLDMPVEEAYDYAAQVMADNMLTNDAEEGNAAFLGKRNPEWTGE
jgi:enoyl-CoA hydratase/carnithine racemase